MKTRMLALLTLVVILPLSLNLASAAPPGLTHIQTLFDHKMEDPSDLVLSPDGRYLYVASYYSDSVTVFQRDADSGDLTFVQFVQDEEGPKGIDGAYGLATSPSGQNLYVVGFHDNALAVFDRDTATGKLDYLEYHRDGAGPVDDMLGPMDVIVSPDGENVYVATYTSDSVVRFSRNLTNGRLTYQDALVDETGPVVDGLDGAFALAFDPEGNHLYVAGKEDNAIVTFSRDQANGALEFKSLVIDNVGTTHGVNKVSDVAVSSDGRYVYGVGSYSGTVAYFSRNTTTGQLTYRGMAQQGYGGIFGMEVPVALAFGPGHNQLYVGSNSGVVAFDRDRDTGELTFINAMLGSGDGMMGLSSTRALAVSPDGRYVYAASSIDDAVGILGRNTTSGRLHPAGNTRSVAGLDGALGVTVSPSGDYVFVTGNVSDSLVVLKRDANTGALSPGALFVDGEDDVDGLNGARSVAVTSDDQYVYVGGYDEDAIAIFQATGDIGLYEYIGLVKNEQGGVLFGLDGVQALAISPDDKFLYAAAYVDDSVCTFRRDTETGMLEFLGGHIDNVGTIDGLDGAYAVSIDPTGSFLYVASMSDNAVAVFTRNWTTGRLKPLEEDFLIKDGDLGIDGLEGANYIAHSPDADYAYVLGRHDDALTMFSRDRFEGTLDYLGVAVDGNNGVEGLNGPRAVQVSPDGRFVYVASQHSDAVTRFQRDPDTGLVTYLDRVQDGVNGVDGLDTANGLAVSGDGRHIYVTGYGDDALAVFGTQVRTYLPIIIRE